MGNEIGKSDEPEVDTSDIPEADEAWFKLAKFKDGRVSHAMDYVGPEGSPCYHYEIAPNRVACGYDIVKQHLNEKHAFARTLAETTCTTCRKVVEQDQRHTSVLLEGE